MSTLSLRYIGWVSFFSINACDASSYFFLSSAAQIVFHRNLNKIMAHHLRSKYGLLKSDTPRSTVSKKARTFTKLGGLFGAFLRVLSLFLSTWKGPEVSLQGLLSDLQPTHNFVALRTQGNMAATIRHLHPCAGLVRRIHSASEHPAKQPLQPILLVASPATHKQILVQARARHAPPDEDAQRVLYGGQ